MKIEIINEKLLLYVILKKIIGKMSGELFDELTENNDINQLFEQIIQYYRTTERPQIEKDITQIDKIRKLERSLEIEIYLNTEDLIDVEDYNTQLL